MSEIARLQIRIESDSTNAAAALDTLANALQRVRTALTGSTGLHRLATDLERVTDVVQKARSAGVADYLNQIADSLENISRFSGIRVPDISNLFRQSRSRQAMDSMNDAAERAYRSTAVIVQEMGELSENRGFVMMDEDIKHASQDLLGFREQLKIGNGYIQGEGWVEIADDANRVVEEMESMDSALEGTMQTQREVEEAAGDTASALSGVGAAADEAGNDTGNLRDSLRELVRHLFNTRSGFTGLIHSFARIATYRMIRSVIKGITDACKEGVTAVREYSDSINGHFASAMDSAEAKLMVMRNSLGAAIAPVLEMLIPILQNIVSHVINVVNWLNQLFALLNGQSSWTKAIDISGDALDDYKKKVNGASKATKNLLADWDELNIIQSQSGSGGGGGSKQNQWDYSKMFTEVYKFNDKIKKVAEFLKKHFKELLIAATAVGAAIKLWSLSGLFENTLGQILGLASAGLVVAITFKLTEMFTGQYLDTGDAGWLIADALSTAVGTTIAWYLARQAIGGAGAAWMIPITLTLSAFAGIKTILSNPDIKALSKENVTATILNAAKAGIGIGYGLFRLGGLALGKAIAGGGAAALITFGAVIGIKTVANAIESDDFSSEEYIAGKVVSSITMGAGGALAAVAAGFGAVGAITGAAGGALITFGVMSGIQAVAEDVKSEENKISVMKYTAASLTAGLGTTITAAMLTGIGTAMVAGAAVGIVGLGVMIGVSAYLQARKENGIKWGSRTLTKSEIQAYVSTVLFNVDVPTTVSVIVDHIESVNAKRAQIREKLTKAIGTMNVIRLGVAQKDDYTNLKTEVDSIIADVDDLVAEAKKTGKLTLTFTPNLMGSGNAADAAKWFGRYTTGWDSVNDWVKSKGAEIGELLVKAEAGTITAKESEVLNSLLESWSNVTNALSNADVVSKAFADLNFNLGDLTEASFDDVMKAYNQYLKDLRNGLRQQYDQNLLDQMLLVDSLFAINPNSEKYKEAKADLDYMMEHMYEGLEDDVMKYAGPGHSIINKWLEEQFNNFNAKNVKFPVTARGIFTDAFVKTLDQGAALRAVVSYWTQIPESALEAVNNSEWWAMLGKDMQEKVVNLYRDMYGDEYMTYLNKAGVSFEPLKAVEEASEAMNTIDWTPYGQYITEQYTKTAELVSEVQTLGDMDVSVSPLDTTAFDATIQDATDRVERFRELYYSLPFDARNTAPASSLHIGGGSWNKWRHYTYASGGFPETGQMFVANEAGPELIGTIGNRTAVANSDQIVAGVANGVAAGQAEQNSLLRQQNEYLRALLNKESTVKVEPSSAWGKFNRRSEAMYARNAGY